MATLSNGSAINRTGDEYSRLDTYIKPYMRMINGTKMQLHKQFSDIMQDNYKYQTWMIMALSCGFVLIGIYLCLQVYTYYSNRAELIKIILQFELAQVSSIVFYWRSISSVF